MIVRVIKGEDSFIGNFETTQELPAVGDTFWYGTHGPYTVSERTFIFAKSEGDRGEDVILTVKEIPKSEAMMFLSKRNRG